jgi:putative transposase
MRSAFRFRLYPSRGQEARMLRALEATRRLWNDALAHRKTRWENERQATSYVLQAWILTAEREQDALLGELYSQAGQDVLRRLDRAFRSFFERRATYPRFKRFSQSGSFAYPQAYNGSVKPDIARRRLFLSKVGNVPVAFHRPLPKDSRLKTCTVVREPDGKWFVSLLFEEIVPLQNIRTAGLAEFITTETKKPIGIDLGLLSVIATSDGEKVEHPTFSEESGEALEAASTHIVTQKEGLQEQVQGAPEGRFRALPRQAPAPGL